MQQKNTHMMFTLIGSIFMMMAVAGLFHVPANTTNTALASSFFSSIKK